MILSRYNNSIHIWYYRNCPEQEVGIDGWSFYILYYFDF